VRIVPRPFVRVLGISAFVVAAACGSHPNPGGPTPTSTPPQIACPADVTVSSVATPAQAVTFTAPTVTGGAAPVTTTCSPASGATCSLGTTPVSCVAADAQARQATCSFKVTLKGFAIAATKFEAFGDSFTAGENGEQGFIDVPNAYPTKLGAMLTATFPDQGIVVLNRGHNGDFVETTVSVLRQYLPADRPEAVLILSGYNNLSACGTGQAATLACRAAIDDVSVGVLDCIRKTRESADSVKYIFVSTLTPPGPVAPNAFRDRRIDRDAIVQANNKIRQRIASERAILVDSYPLFIGHESEYVDTDGLHLRPAGYQALANAFFAAIQQTIAQTPLFGFTFPN
jgi:lysophospholipase L1-like esterase